MKCASCGSINPSPGKFCSHCGAHLKGSPRCESCGASLLEDALFCRNCGFDLGRAPLVQVTVAFESELYRRCRHAFFHRFVERVEKKTAEGSLYGVVRLLARRPIEIEMGASLGELAEVLTSVSKPYVAVLRNREVLAELSDFLAGVSGDAQQKLAELDAASAFIAADLVDHSTGRSICGSANTMAPLVHCTWPGIGACIGPAVEIDQIGGKLTPEVEKILLDLNRTFLDFVGAYDRLWPPLFLFVERFLAKNCHLLWQRFAHFEYDFRRYSALIAQAKTAADANLFEEALVATRLARAVAPDEPLALLLEGQVLYRLGRRPEAVAAFEQAATLQLPFVSLHAEKLFWSGRCLFFEERFEEAAATFEALLVLPKQQLEERYLLEGQFLLAYAQLLLHDGSAGVKSLQMAITRGFTDVGGLLTDSRLAALRGAEPLRGALRQSFFLLALARQAGILALGSTYTSRTAAAIRLAAGTWLELEEGEEIVFLYDASHRGNGRFGICLSNRRLLWKTLSGPKHSLQLELLRFLEQRGSELVINQNQVLPSEVFDRMAALLSLLASVQKVFGN